MILHRNYWTEHVDDLVKNSYTRIVLNVDHLGFAEDQERFELGIELISLCNSITMINNFFKKAGIKKEIEFSILRKAIEVLHTEEPLSDAELKTFFKFNKNLEDIARSMQNVSSDLTEQIFINTKIEMLMIGIGLNDQLELRRFDTTGDGEGKFFDLKWEVIEGKRTALEYKQEALKFYNEFVKSASKAKKEEAA